MSAAGGRLSAEEKRKLRNGADPRNPAPDTTGWPEQDFVRLLDAAQHHGVFAIVWRKLRDGARSACTTPGFRIKLERYEQVNTLAIGQSMMLRHHAGRIGRALREREISAEIIKGPVFADHIYDVASDRPFTDIDILADVADLARINEVVEACGFVQESKSWDNSERYQEYKWYLRDNTSIMVEVQGNMVHYPALRRRLSFGYDELKATGSGPPPSAACMLLIAVVHAFAGHKFHRLQFAVDIAHAARRIEDPAELMNATQRVGAELEVATALAVTGRLFQDAEILALGRRFPETIGTRLGGGLITEDTILDAVPETTRGSHLRRHAFRWIQLLPSAARTA